MILLAAILAACNGCSNQPDVSVHTELPYLISSSHKFVMDGVSEEGLPFLQDRLKFIEPYIFSEYRGDTLVVKTLQEVNSCADVIGKIDTRNDTIHLQTTTTNNELCNSFELHEFTYLIKVDKKYKIGW